MASVEEQLQNLVLSDIEIANMTGWPPKMIEDYLNIVTNFILLASTVDISDTQIQQNTDDIATNVTNISTNSADISTNATNISTNAGDISDNSGDISTNATNIGTNTTNLSNHIALVSAHGVTGDNVGTSDFCTTILGGVVLLSSLVNDAVASTVSVSSPDASAAPVAYDQTQIEEIVTLANEMKADINTLVTDVNNAITQINDFIAKNKTANQMSSV